jgi:hypothetical protein
MLESLRPIWDTVGALLLAGGGGAIVAIGIFRFTGEAWLNHRFSTKMVQFTHARDQQIERLRFKINELFDRRTKLAQREFETVPQAWSLLVTAHHEVARFLSPLQQYPDLDRMDEQSLQHFLDNLDIPSHEKQRLKNSQRKSDDYRKIDQFRRAMKANNHLYDAFVYYQQNAIFMQDSLREPFDEILELMRMALIEQKINFEMENRPWVRDSIKKFEVDGKLLLARIKSEIQDRLWSPERDD